MILADENVAAPVVELAQSIPDAQVLDEANRRDVLLRLTGVPMAQRAEMVVRLFREMGAELIGAFTVLDARGRVRLRRLSPRAP